MFALFAAAFAAVLVWWQRLAPANDRVWADAVAKMTTGVVYGNRAVLTKVRNFDWHSATGYTQRWEARAYDLDRLNAVDTICAYWGRRAVAHIQFSFGFVDGAQVVFWVEIRRERAESFFGDRWVSQRVRASSIAADDRDVIRVRTDARHEGGLSVSRPIAGA